MKTPTVVPFLEEHLDGFVGVGLELGWHRNHIGPAFTAMVDDKTIGAAGVTVIWPGVGHAWTVLGSEIILRYRVWMTRTIRRCLRDIIRAHQLHRVEAIVLANELQHRRWIEVFGFEPEGTAHEFTTDRQDVVRYELVVNSPEISVREEDGETRCEAVVSGQVIGHVSHRLDPEGNAYGTGAEVVTSYRGKGLMLRLHQARLLAAARQGAKCFVIVNDVHHAAVIHVAEKCGATKCVNALGTTWVTPLVPFEEIAAIVAARRSD